MDFWHSVNLEYHWKFMTALQLVDEFLTGQRINMAPQTFHMGSLLQEMREIEEQEYKHAPQRGERGTLICPVWSIVGYADRCKTCYVFMYSGFVLMIDITH